MAFEEKRNLVSEALLRLHYINFKVFALVCEGPATNFVVATKLGASLTTDSMKPFLPHPCASGKLVHVIFDACHMLNLMRNVLAEKGILTSITGEQMKWQ